MAEGVLQLAATSSGRSRTRKGRRRSVEGLTPEDALRWAALIAGVLSAFTGVVHFAYAPPHFSEGHDHGLFFVIVGVSQLVASWLLIYRAPSLPVAAVTLLGTTVVAGTYLLSRTIGLPIGTNAGEVEAVAFLDLATTLLEAMAVSLLAIVVFGALAGPRHPAAQKNHTLAALGGGMALQLLALTAYSLLLTPRFGVASGVLNIAEPFVYLAVAAGLALMLTGLIAEALTGEPAGSASARFLANPGVATFGLVFALGVTGALAVSQATAGSGSHHLGSRADAAAHVEGSDQHHTLSEDALAKDPTYATLKDVLKKQGTQAAIARLEQLASSDDAVLREAHPLVHALGRASFGVYGSASKALGECTAVFASGCYHGVLEEYLRTKSTLEAKDVVSLCSGIDSRFIKFQCLHGMGHGLTMYYQQDLFQPLKVCDYLSAEWDRQSCYGGVFMQNIAGFGEAKVQGQKTFLKAEDPLYPCDSVASKYQYQCFNLQTSAMLLFNGQNYAKTAQECDKAPGDYAGVCYRSLGRDISGAMLRNPDKSLDLCQLGTAKYWGECLVGVAKDFINTDSKTDDALVLCQKAPGSAKDSCYGAIGEILIDVIPDPQARAKECAKAEANYIDVCRRSARL